MKTIIQFYKTGELKTVETPAPSVRPGYGLVHNAFSVISAGTEKIKVDTARKSLLGKAMARPDLVKQVIAKAKKEGLWRTWQVVSDKLDAPTPLGYSSAGQIIEVHSGVAGVKSGDWVACGGSTANHAEIVCVPANLIVKIPEGVSTDSAAFTTLGAIAMQGVRQAEVRLGEKVVVIGLGLIGLLTVQILRAAGCRVLGTDIDPAKVSLARELGCEQTLRVGDGDLEEHVLLFTGGYGADATLITAGTSSNEPIERAGEITREKGRVVVVGAAKMDIPREPYYLKEIDLRISRSYGPGRYDPTYEEHGHDYPFGYVRFTEQRNMACFLELLQSGAVKLDKIITHRFPIEEAPRAYELISGQRKEPYLGILLEYKRPPESIPRRVELFGQPIEKGRIVVGVIGAGSYASKFLLPGIRDHAELAPGSVCTASGITAENIARKFGFRSAESDADAVIKSSDAVVIATRHNSHAELVVRALQQGKPVFVEKPLAITQEQLHQVLGCLSPSNSSQPTSDLRPLDVGPAPSPNSGQPSTINHQPSTQSHPSSPSLPLRAGERAGVRCAADSQLSTLNSQPSLTVGFNRRFAPATRLVLEHLASVPGPRQVLIRVNAGEIPGDHWIHDPQVGGGRLVGEGCHFVDLAVLLTGSLVTRVSAAAIPRPDSVAALWDNFTINLAFANGSLATVFYTSVGDAGLAKENIQVFAGGRAAIIDDFCAVELWAHGRKKRQNWSRQDKGQTAEIEAWIRGLKTGRSSIPLGEIINTQRACFAAIESIQIGATVSI